MVKSFEDCLW